MKRDSVPPNLYFDKGTKGGKKGNKEKGEDKKIIMSWINLLVSSPSTDPVTTHRSLKAMKGGRKRRIECIVFPFSQSLVEFESECVHTYHFCAD